MNKKVYFAGSIRGGRADAELYQTLIAHIKKTDCVLTEHVGITTLSVLEGEADSEQKIYAQDTSWLAECDIVIAECSQPSLGVGYELAYAERLGKECHILYRKSRGSLSAMLKGNVYFKLHQYETPNEALAIIDAILKTTKE